MALDELLTALEREATHTAEHLLAEARAEAERLTRTAEADLTRRRDGAATAAERERRAALERELSDAAREALRATLTARGILLDRAFAAARAALPGALGETAYLGTLPARVEAAAECFDQGEPTVLRCSPPLVAPLRIIAAAHGTMTVQADEGVGSGFRLTTADGAIAVDDTLDTRLSAAYTTFARLAWHHLEPHQ